MKNVEKMFDEALNIVATCIGNDKIGMIYRPITINTRAKTRFGRCSTSDRVRFRIEVSNMILGDSVPYDATMSVMIHEILHACKGGQSHTGAWARYAKIINARFPQYEIKRTDSAERFGIKYEETATRSYNPYKYAIECCNCGMVHHSSRMSKSIQHPEHYRCGKCGGKLIRIA